MGERFDVIVALGDGVFPLVALAEGKKGPAFGLIRTAAGTAPKPKVRPAALNGHLLGYDELVPAEAVRLDDRKPDQVIQMELTGGTTSYSWGFNGRPLTHETLTEHLVPIHAGERIQLDLVTPLTCGIRCICTATRSRSARPPAPARTPSTSASRTGVGVFEANNPGLWVLHCHNIYHAESGMMAALGYRR